MIKQRYNERGITLIALVITIIVLLILAGVAISMLSGENGIINQVSKVQTETSMAEFKEKVKIDIMEAQIDLYTSGKQTTLQNVANTLKEKGLYSDIVFIGDKIEIKEGSKIAKIDEKLTVSVRNDNQPDLKIGDYIKYSPTVINNYEVKADVTGATETQIFSTDENARWRVLTANEETVTLISSTVLHQNGLKLNGAIGYNNSVETINDICEKLYSNKTKGINARSVKSYDIETFLGVDEWDEEWKEGNSDYGQTYNVINYNENNKIPDIVTNKSNDLGYSNASSLELKNNYKVINYQNTPNFKPDSTNPIFQIMVVTGNYWVATRYIDSHSGYAAFNVATSIGLSLGSNKVFNSSDSVSGTNEPAGIRPVIEIPFSIVIKGGIENGTADNPYSLNI